MIEPDTASGERNAERDDTPPERICPRCNGVVLRVRRRLRDRILALIVPVRRYRCRDLGCCWEGLMRAQRNPTPGQRDPHWMTRALRPLLSRSSSRDAMRHEEARFRAISDASPLGLFVSDARGRCIYSNAAYQKIAGLDFEHTLGTHWDAAVHPRDRERVRTEEADATLRHAPFQTECRWLRDDGSVAWIRVHRADMGNGPIPDSQVQTFEDITAHKSSELGRRAAEVALFEEKERARVTLDSIGDAVLTTDLLGNVVLLNLAAEAMTGWSRKDSAGRPLADVFRIVDGTTRQSAQDPARRAMEEDRTIGLAAGCVLITRGGDEVPIEDSAAPIHDRHGRVSGAVLVFRDVSQSREMVRKMSHLAHHDSLTGLPNRMLLTERVTRAIGLAHRHGRQVALLFLDLDDFKSINDSLGHEVGDQVLRCVAERLTSCVRATDTVCRRSGDEFVVLLAEIEEPLDAVHVAEKCRAALAAPQVVGGHELQVTLSIGISVYPDDGSNADTVMQNADAAMYYAKAGGRGGYQLFSPEMTGVRSNTA